MQDSNFHKVLSTEYFTTGQCCTPISLYYTNQYYFIILYYEK